MSATDETLLAFLRTTAGSRGNRRLEAEVVRIAGEMLGLPDAALVEAIDRLAKAGEVRLSFGGTVEVADKAPAAHESVHIVNSTVNWGNGNQAVGNGATAGDHAIGANALVVLGHLAAAKAELIRDPSPEARDLSKAADDLAEIAKAPKAPGMSERLKNVGGIIDTSLALPGKIAGAVEAMKTAYDTVAPWVS